MGSHVDALKLVSCLTLFRHVALGRCRPPSRGPSGRRWPSEAQAILAAAAAQGLPPCRFTEERCRAGSR